MNKQQRIYPWHKTTWQQFSHAYFKNHLPHAILIAGARGVGKADFSKRMVKSLLCHNPVAETMQACGDCRGCRTLESGANPDFFNIQLLEGKQQIGVNQIRELSDFLPLSRSFNAYRVVLINQIETMNQNAANSLLKSLEEPADNTVIILTTDYLSKIIPTIISRSQILSLALPKKDVAIDWIKSQKPDFDDDFIHQILEISSGSPLLALNTDQETLNSKIDFLSDIDSVAKQNKSITEVAKKWEKYDQSSLLNWQLIQVQKEIKSNLTASSNTTDNLRWKLYQQLLDTKKIIHTSVNSLINLENMLSLWLQSNPK